MKIEEPDTITCYFCSTPGMGKKHRVETSKFVRVLWHCTKCGCEYWKDYGDKESARERKKRWHGLLLVTGRARWHARLVLREVRYERTTRSRRHMIEQLERIEAKLDVCDPSPRSTKPRQRVNVRDNDIRQPGREDTPVSGLAIGGWAQRFLSDGTSVVV